MKLGQIVILNGAPRAGKSSIAAAIQNGLEGLWMNLGVDTFAAVTPERCRPGIGLRPGGERPDLEPVVTALYAALYESVAASSRLGLNVVVDVGHHDAYSRPLNILGECAWRLRQLPVLFVGIRCPLEVILERRRRGQAGREQLYDTGTARDPIPAPVRLWQAAVHAHGLYDLELDTSALSPAECAQAIAVRLRGPEPTAFARLAAAAARPPA